MDAAVLAAVDVRKRFGALTVLDGVNQSSVETLNLAVAGRGGAQGEQY